MSCRILTSEHSAKIRNHRLTARFSLLTIGHSISLDAPAWCQFLSGLFPSGASACPSLHVVRFPIAICVSVFVFTGPSFAGIFCRRSVSIAGTVSQTRKMAESPTRFFNTYSYSLRNVSDIVRTCLRPGEIPNRLTSTEV